MSDPICKFNNSKANAINCLQFIYETTDAQDHLLHASCHHVGIVYKGDGMLTVNNESVRISQSDIYFIKKDSTFSIKRSPEMEYFYISFSGWHADELMDRIGISTHNFVFRGHNGIVEFWTSCFDKSVDSNLDLFSEAVLLFTAANLSDKQKEKSPLSERIAEYINEHFNDPGLKLSAIASALGYDPKYLSSVFKTKQGITITNYMKSLRVKHAAFLFEEGVESVKSVALLSGFSDALYFSKVFKQETGLSPSDYIKQVAASR